MNLRKRWIVLLALIVAVLIYLGSGLFTVAQDEQGVILRFGAVSRTVGPGLNYRLPWPFERVYRVQTAKEYYMSVGYKIKDQLQGIPPLEREMQWLTGDTNLVNIRLYIRYRTKDPVEFLFRTEEPRFLVRRAAEGMLTEQGSRHHVKHESADPGPANSDPLGQGQAPVDQRQSDPRGPEVLHRQRHGQQGQAHREHQGRGDHATAL